MRQHHCALYERLPEKYPAVSFDDYKALRNEVDTGRNAWYDAARRDDYGCRALHRKFIVICNRSCGSARDN